MNEERPIGKLLRRFAKKRREDAGAPLEMHPATRRLLQGEVARQFRKGGTEKNSFIGRLTALRGRWLYVTATASAVLIAATWMLMNNSKPAVGNLAKQEAAPAKSPPRRLAAELAKNFDQTVPMLAPAPETGVVAEEPINAPALAAVEKPKDTDEWKAAGPVVTVTTDSERRGALADRSDATTTTAAAGTAGETYIAGNKIAPAPALAPATDKLDESLAGARRLTPSPVSASAPASPGRSAAVAAARPRPAATESFAGVGAGQDSQVGTATPAAPPPADAAAVFESRASAPIARGGGVERENLPALSQSFANLSPNPKSERKLKAAPTSPVLLNFQVEQAGNQLRVIDGDGSTYLGEVGAAHKALSGDKRKGAEALKDARKLALASPAQSSAANNFYRVTGTNRTLNQQVVFTWNFIEVTNALAQAQAVGGSLKNQTANSTQQIPALFNNSGISGRAQINASKEIEINAVPVNP